MPLSTHFGEAFSGKRPRRVRVGEDPTGPGKTQARGRRKSSDPFTIYKVTPGAKSENRWALVQSGEDIRETAAGFFCG
jgi:hypothetical protein